MFYTLFRLLRQFLPKLLHILRNLFKQKAKSGSKFFTLHSSLFTFHLPQALSLQFPARSTAVAATLVVATLGDVLFAKCSGSCLRVNLLPTYLVRELAAELGGYGATQSAPSVGCVQHLGGCHDGRMCLRVFRVPHAELKVGIDGQEVLASLR